MKAIVMILFFLMVPAVMLLPGGMPNPDRHPGDGSDIDHRDCDVSQLEMARTCDLCGEVDPQLVVDDDCARCRVPVRWVEVCVKTYAVCNTCGNLFVEKKCCSYPDWEGRTVKARVLFRCQGCGASGDLEMDCINEPCAKRGRIIRRTCERSGIWPHKRSGVAPGRRT